MVLKEKEIYNRFTEESFEKINNLDKSVDTDKLIFTYKGDTADENFSRFDNALDLIEKIRNGEISLNEAKDEQEKFESKHGEIKKVRQKNIYQKKIRKQKQIYKIFIMQEKQLLIFLMNTL